MRGMLFQTSCKSRNADGFAGPFRYFHQSISSVTPLRVQTGVVRSNCMDCKEKILFECLDSLKLTSMFGDSRSRQDERHASSRCQVVTHTAASSSGHPQREGPSR